MYSSVSPQKSTLNVFSSGRINAAVMHGHKRIIYDQGLENHMEQANLNTYI